MPQEEALGRRQTDIQEWRWIPRGALLKLIALLLGGAGCLAIFMAAGWDVERALQAPQPVGLGVLLIAVVTDIVGRLLFLGAPQTSSRFLVLVSVSCQFSAVVLLVFAALAPPPPSERPLLLNLAALGQIAAAVTFTMYLNFLGKYFNIPIITNAVQRIKTSFLSSVTFASALGGLTLVFLAAAAIVAVLSLFCCFPLGWLAVGAMEFAMTSLSYLLLTILLIFLGIVELAYGTALTALLVELRQRRD